MRSVQQSTKGRVASSGAFLEPRSDPATWAPGTQLEITRGTGTAPGRVAACIRLTPRDTARRTGPENGKSPGQ
jgi:hypothetical protein